MMKTILALATALSLAGAAVAQDPATPPDAPAATGPSAAFEIGRRAGETQAAQARTRALARSRASARSRAALQQELTNSMSARSMAEPETVPATTSQRPAYAVDDNPPVNGPVPSTFAGGLRTPWDPR